MKQAIPLLLVLTTALLTGCATPPPAAKTDDSLARKEPPSATGNPESYVALGQRYYIARSSEGYKEQGVASWYGPDFHGKKTSSGKVYDMYGISAAHKTLPIPTYVKVTNLDNGKHVIVRVDDRGPFKPGRIIDLSYNVAQQLDVVRHGTARVEVEALAPYQYLAGSGPGESYLASLKRIGGETALAQRNTLAAGGLANVAGVQATPLSTGSSLTVTPLAAAESKSSPLAAPVPNRVAANRPPASPLAPGGAPLGAGALYVQVGAFSQRQNAEQLRQQLQSSLGRNSSIASAGNLHRVRIGPLRDRQDADQTASRLSSLGFSNTVVQD